MALSAVLAALYGTYVLIFGFVSFGPLQFRLVDALIPLSIVLGPAGIAGVTIGCFIGNAFGPNLGVIDIVGGPMANFLAATLAYATTRKQFRGSWILAISLAIGVIAAVVGTYVVLLTGVPFWVNWLQILASEIVIMGIVGYPLLKAVARETRRNPSLGPQNPS